MSNAELSITGTLDEWIQALPSYQSKLLQSMVSDGDVAEAASKWLEASIAENTAPLGVVRIGAEAFYDKLLNDLKELICKKGVRYNKERSQLLTQAKMGKSVLIVFISTTLAPHINLSPVVLGPAVALVLAVLSSAGQESICTVLDRLIEDRNKTQRTDESSS